MSPALRLKPGTSDSLCSVLPAQAPLLHHCGRYQKAGAGSARSLPPCHVLAAGRPGVACGVCRAASVTGHWPHGWRHQRKEPNLRRLGQGEGPALAMLPPLVLMHHPICLFLQGGGKARNSAPAAFPVSPSALCSRVPKMPLLLRLSGAFSQFSI